jgi:hypothetical protein
MVTSSVAVAKVDAARASSSAVVLVRRRKDLMPETFKDSMPEGRESKNQRGNQSFDSMYFPRDWRAAGAVELGPGLGVHGDGFGNVGAAFSGAEFSARAFAGATVGFHFVIVSFHLVTVRVKIWTAASRVSI